MQATVVGIFGFGKADNLGGATLVGFDPATAQKALNGGGKYDTIDVAAEPGVSPDELKSAITKILPSGVEAKTGRGGRRRTTPTRSSRPCRSSTSRCSCSRSSPSSWGSS